MKYSHALLVGAADENPQEPLRPGPSLDAIEGLLTELGGWTITRVEGAGASRDGILRALDALEHVVRGDDACLFYFFGHGGAIEIADLPAPLGGRPVFYLVPTRPDFRQGSRTPEFEAVLDVELSLIFARIDAVCGNVSVILDCCHSARIVRGPERQLNRSPNWVHEVAEQTRECDDLLTPESHPRIVRLTGSSALRWGYADPHPNPNPTGHLGRLTRFLVEVVREAMPHIDRLTWDAVAHRVREQAIWRLYTEDQWVTLAGPRERIVFSRETAELAPTVSFVPYEDRPGGWIRAGALQGVQLGDEWNLVELTLDERLCPRRGAKLQVIAVEPNRAALELVESGSDRPSEPPRPGTRAQLLRSRSRKRVLVEGSGELHAAIAIDRSSWVCSTTDAAGLRLASVRVNLERLELHHQSGELAPASFTADEVGTAAAIDRLEDWARAATLLDAITQHPRVGEPVIHVSWTRESATRSRGRPPNLPLDDPKLCLHVRDRIGFRIQQVGTRDEWFVCAVEIAVDGRPMLLNASEPNGLQLPEGRPVELGRQAHRRDQGFELSWPDGVPTDRPRPVTLVFLASPRPIQLAHLVRNVRLDPLPRAETKRRRARVRGHLEHPRPQPGPKPIREWSWQVIRYVLDPRPRDQ